MSETLVRFNKLVLNKKDSALFLRPALDVRKSVAQLIDTAR